MAMFLGEAPRLTSSITENVMQDSVVTIREVTNSGETGWTLQSDEQVYLQYIFKHIVPQNILVSDAVEWARAYLRRLTARDLLDMIQKIAAEKNEAALRQSERQNLHQAAFLQMSSRQAMRFSITELETAVSEFNSRSAPIVIDHVAWNNLGPARVVPRSTPSALKFYAVKNRNGKNSKKEPAPVSVDLENIKDEIRAVAKEKWISDGQKTGNDISYWVAAERQLHGEDTKDGNSYEVYVRIPGTKKYKLRKVA